MKTKNKHQYARGEVTELARETAKIEQYWIVGDRSEPHSSIASGGKSGNINRARGATALASWCRSMAANTGGSRIAGHNAPYWCSSTTRPAG